MPDKPIVILEVKRSATRKRYAYALLVCASVAALVSTLSGRKHGSNSWDPNGAEVDALHPRSNKTLGPATGSQGGDRDASTNASPRARDYMPDGYRAAAVQAMIQEVKQFVQETGIDDAVPISEATLRESIVHTPFISRHAKMFAVVRTEKYLYSAAQGNKLSYVMRVYSEPDGYKKDLDCLRRDQARPLNQVDTNGAIMLAKMFMRDARMDIERLSKDCAIEVKYWTLGAQFVPLYSVAWLRGQEAVASVELVEPTRTLRKLRVEDSNYNLRTELKVSSDSAMERDELGRNEGK